MEGQDLRAEAAHRFSQAADALVSACRQLEQCGIPDEPVEAVLQALEGLTHQVHQLHPPDERVQREPADAIQPACQIRPS